MDYKFTDLEKTENYIGFESGIFCTYPNPSRTGYANNSRTYCEEEDIYEFIKDKNYFDLDKLPTHYDPRCRPWYKAAHKKNTTVISDPYQFTNGILGMTTCIPLWREPNSAEKGKGVKDKQFHGSFCYDVKPTSGNDEFLKKYYSIDRYHIDYLIFHEDEKFEEKQYLNSSFGKLSKELVFNKTFEDIQYKYKVNKISIEAK